MTVAMAPVQASTTDHWVGTMAWDQVRDRIAENAPAILPVGAGAKEHGWHMPMATDEIQAAHLADELAGRIGGLIWPVVTYGSYPAFTAYAGSISLSAGVFQAMIRELTEGLLAHGLSRVLVLDTGISTIAPISAALAGFERAHHLRIHAGPRYRAEAARLAGQSWGTHADELETSRMLALAPERVDMTRAVRHPRTTAMPPGPLHPTDTASPNWSASGVTGDPTLATAAKGRTLLVAMLDDLEEMARAAMVT